jgi:hypothetical protein
VVSHLPRNNHQILTVERFQCLLKNVNHLCGGHTEQVVEKETSSMTWVRFKVACSSSSRLLQYNTKQREYTRYKICIHKLHPYLWARLHHIHSEIHLRHTTARLIGAVYWFCACSRWQSPSTRNI